MPWLRLDDVGYDDPLVRAVGNSAYGASTRMGQYASAHRTDGWIPASKAREIASRAELRALTETHLGDAPPMLHQPGDSCRCLEDKDWQAALGGYWLHAFLDKNPSRAENDVQRAKARELKDKELRRVVRDRDGDQCRYCSTTVVWADRKSPRGGVLDHVDPTIAAGADNLVVCCRGCNGRKKDCTPAAAGMELRPVPGTTGDQEQITAGSTADQATDQRTTTAPITDPVVDPDHPPDGADPAEPQVTTSAAVSDATSDATTGETTDRMTDGTGRGGHPRRSALADAVGNTDPHGVRTQVGPATTPRGHLAPNPYFKATTANPPPQPT